MGQEFGDDGKLVKWSDIINYDSPELLKASSYIPISRGIFIDTKNFEDITSFDITEYIDSINNITGDLRQNPDYYKKLAEIIIDIYDFIDKNNLDNKIKITFDEAYEEIGKIIVQDLIRHERTKTPINLEEKAYKNYISNSIKNIVQDIRNMNASHSPVMMDDLQDLASNSEKGLLTLNMSQMNPLTKLSMQAQNMVGKKVIGIAAVAEKVFYNLSYYYNEGLKNGDEKWLQNMKFNKTFNRIKGRHSNNIVPQTVISLADVNFENVELYRVRMFTINEVDEQLRQKYQITNEDIENKSSDRYKQYYEELTETFSGSPVDAMISQILSAATDNAKELILDKINCGEDFAKFHLYLLMLGFDIKDVVSFMTTPVVNLINLLSKANMMDDYSLGLRLDDAIKLADGIINTKRFIFGQTRNEETGKVVHNSFTVYGSISRKIINTLNKFSSDNKLNIKISDLQSLIQVYIKAKISGLGLNSINTYASGLSRELRKELNILSDYVDKIVYQISKAINQYGDNALYEFEQDLNEFKKIHKLANETSSLGGVFLGLNQGLPSDKSALQNKLRQISKIMSDREDYFNIFKNSFEKPKKNLERFKQKFESIVKSITEENQLLTDEIVISTLHKAHAFGLVKNLNVEHWLLDKKLTRDDIVNTEFIDQQLDIDSIMNGQEEISYRELVSDYYNIIKGTWNVFDIITKIPQYNAILELFKSVYIIDKYSSLKSYLSNIIYDDIINRTRYIDETQSKQIYKYVQDLVIVGFFRDNNFSMPILRGMKKFTPLYQTEIVNNNTSIDLNNAVGRASFKQAFETIMLQLKNTGRWGNITIPNYRNNRLLRDLKIIFDHGSPVLSLELDLNQAYANDVTQRIFQQYLTELNKFNSEEYKIGQYTIAEWFMLYNLFTNQNMYGSDRFTVLFKNLIEDENSLINKFFKYVGELDIAKYNDDILEDLGYDIEDLYFRIAPFVHPSQEHLSQSHIIKSKNTLGEIIYKKRVNGVYKEISKFPIDEILNLDSRTISDEQRFNYNSHQKIPMRFQDLSTSMREGFMSSDLDTVVKTLILYSRKGLLNMILEC